MPLLRVKNLQVEYCRRGNVIPALRGISLSLYRNETVGIVGESGCGKSTLVLSILNLISEKEGRIKTGQILFRDEDVLSMTEERLREIRGKDISLIFQDPFTSFNPVFTIGSQIVEAILTHRDIGKDEAEKKTMELLRMVQLSREKEIFHSYPHQLSGGMLQRCTIAMALSCNPSLLLADEPTTALDVTVQKEILMLLKRLKGEFNLSIIFVTHDLNIVRMFCDRLLIMYAGVIVEEGSTESIFNTACHPYTIGLLNSRPRPRGGKRLKAVPGQVPDMQTLPEGCKFHPRCPEKQDRCGMEEVPLREVGRGHLVRCERYAGS